jgi:GxxExxY protein
MKEPDKQVDDLARAAIGAAIEVHRTLGPGFPESVYEEVLSVELELRAIPFERQVPISIAYKTRSVGLARLDYLIDGLLVLELKAVEQVLPVHRAIVISYLKTSKRELGLLINFHVPILRNGIERTIRT